MTLWPPEPCWAASCTARSSSHRRRLLPHALPSGQSRSRPQGGGQLVSASTRPTPADVRNSPTAPMGGRQPWLCSATCHLGYFEIHHPSLVVSRCRHHHLLGLPAPLHPRRPSKVLLRRLPGRRLPWPARREPARATVPKAQPCRPITVYECDGCGNRASATVPRLLHLHARDRPRRRVPRAAARNRRSNCSPRR